jgi:4-amino-4-deoxy-L-arabinose transferase-like glycosyltransferase
MVMLRMLRSKRNSTMSTGRTYPLPAKKSARRIGLIIGVVIALHCIVWSCLPLLLEGSIRLDVAEHVLQGREWLLAYPKHPPFSMWLVAAASNLGPVRYVAVYMLGQILALSGLLFAALLLLRQKGSSAAALAVLVGLASPFLTYVPIELNHNIGVMPFWGLAIAAGFFAFERGLLRDWLLFGVAVGLGMWAKYSILQLAFPLAAVFIAVPEWRRQITTPGPWLSIALAAAIAEPQLVAVVNHGSGAFLYALRPNPLGVGHNLASSFEFLLNSTALIALMAIVPAAAVGSSQLWHSIAQSYARARADRLTLYLHVALFGPIAVIALASLFGVRPRVFWLTPVALSAAVWWAEKLRLTRNRLPRCALEIAGGLAVLLAASYSVWHVAKPLALASPSYADFDGPALARIAEQFWRTHNAGPIPYIVSFDRTRGRQAAGSIVFDTSDRPHVFEDTDLKLSPWIDPSDLIRRGALVVSPRPLTSADYVSGRPIEFISEFKRPTIRAFSRPRPIYLGIVRPAD